VQNHFSSLQGDQPHSGQRMRGSDGIPVAFNLTVRRNGGSITLWTHLFGSLKSPFFGKAASIPPDYTHLFPTETSVLDRHPEERVLVLLIVGGESILVK
jgi:hypothetical protein